MEINSRSEPKHESCESNESNDHIVNSNSLSSASEAKSIEKSSSSTNKGKRTLWGRTSVSAIITSIVVYISASKIILQFYWKTLFTGKERFVNRGGRMLQ
jgi:hypothetical protein